MLTCPKCGSSIPETAEKCLTCGFNAGPPNVRAAQTKEAIKALEERYEGSLEQARANGYLPILEGFSSALLASSAVINVDGSFLHFFATSGKRLYASYEHGVGGHARKPAAFPDDAARRIVGSTLFAGYASDMRYAALSLNGSGPQSYGPYAMRLRDIAIKQRATVLETNSFDFVKDHNLGPHDKIPPGHLATWENRNKLAVAKLAPYISPTTNASDFPGLLLSSSGNRATDSFVEVQIYGTFDLQAVESVSGSSNAGSRDERHLLRMIKEHLKKAGIPWIEND